MTKQGFSTTYAAKTPTSKRTVVAYNKMEEARMDSMRKNNVEDKQKYRRGKKKENRIDSLFAIKSNVEFAMKRENLAKSPHFFGGNGITKEREGVTMIPLSKLELVKKNTGCVHWVDESAGIFSSLLIPREESIAAFGKKMKNSIEALDCLQSIEKDCNRSKLKTGVTTSKSKYVIYGLKVQRGSTGFSRDKLFETKPQQANRLEELARKCECIAAKYISSHWLRGMEAAEKDGCWETVASGVKFVAALASTINYSAPAHVDCDFVMSIHQMNVDTSSGLLLEDEIAQYFCFPEFGYAVGLRPGDVLLFNPQVYHCLSKKEPVYKDANVHVTTFYLKTAHVGKNDNSLPLSAKDAVWYEMNIEK
jgi:hypothetical protein